MEEYNYDALSSTIKFEDITSSKKNQDTLRRLKENDVDKLYICDQDQIRDEDIDFCPINGEELGWLGYYIGKNTTLDTLVICTTPSPSCNAGVEDFRRGLGRNNSIQSIVFCRDLSDGQVFRMLDILFRNNNLTEMVMEDCDLGPEGIRQLSLALRGFDTSLKRINLATYEIGDGQSMDIIAALHTHPQLEHLDLAMMNIGRSSCTALADLLRNTTQHLQTLNLSLNNIDDEGIEALTDAISGSQLQVLDLSSQGLISNNRTITAKGWKTLSTLLETPDSNLIEIDLSANNVDDEGALFFANALRGNCTLQKLDLSYCGITNEGWAHFSSLLCDTSSVSNTYLSNHSLKNLGFRPHELPTDVHSYLTMNRTNEDKGQLAMTKILQHHSHFNMQPFFEWEFKVLPLMINWLEKARAGTSNFEEKIDRMKLSITYDFVREFPMLYIEPVTRKEIEECDAMEEQLQWTKFKRLFDLNGGLIISFV